MSEVISRKESILPVEKLNAKDIVEALTKNPYSPEEVLSLLKRDSELAEVYKKNGAAETPLDIHTTRVMQLFEEQIQDIQLPTNFSLQQIRLFLALHDIGKPRALEMQQPQREHEFSLKIIAKLIKRIPLPFFSLRFAQAFLEEDPIGLLFQNKISLHDAAETQSFSKRDETTVAPFPDLNLEALSIVLELVQKRQSSVWEEIEQEMNRLANLKRKLLGELRRVKKQEGIAEVAQVELEISDINEKLNILSEQKIKLIVSQISYVSIEKQNELMGLLQECNFDQLYAWVLNQVVDRKEDTLSISEGEWIQYKQGSDPAPLVKSLQGKNTGWSTVGESTAKKYLEEGDIYVYYSLDNFGHPTVPRISIKMRGKMIQQVRGIAHRQNIDSNIQEVLEAKLKEFLDGPSFDIRMKDAKQLTEIENKIHNDVKLEREDLLFLYEIHRPIESFGYERDSRIRDLQKQRNTDQDILTIFDCTENQIARNNTEINENTRVYIGPIQPGVFKIAKVYNLEYIYTSFPERKIELSMLTIGGKSKDTLLEELHKNNIRVSLYAEEMVKGDFSTGEYPQNIDIVLLSIADLGFDKEPNIDQIYSRAKEFGLSLCPAEAALYRCLQDRKQPPGSWYVTAMKRLQGRDGDGRIFRYLRRGNELWLHDYWSYPTDPWLLSTKILFCVM